MAIIVLLARDWSSRPSYNSREGTVGRQIYNGTEGGVGGGRGGGCGGSGVDEGKEVLSANRLPSEATKKRKENYRIPNYAHLSSKSDLSSTAYNKDTFSALACYIFQEYVPQWCIPP